MNGFVYDDFLVYSGLRETMIAVFEENRLKNGSELEPQSIKPSLTENLQCFLEFEVNILAIGGIVERLRVKGEVEYLKCEIPEEGVN
jgi:hypothetical protein